LNLDTKHNPIRSRVSQHDLRELPEHLTHHHQLISAISVKQLLREFCSAGSPKLFA
jgi:hypothetical protein